MGETINQRIAIYRKLANLTQAQTAEKLGTKCSTYSQMERKGKISAQMVLKLAEIFNVHPNLLLYGEEPYIVPVEPKISDTELKQPKKPPFPPPKPITVLTNSEENIIKIIRNVSKEDKADIMAYIEKIYKKNRK